MPRSLYLIVLLTLLGACSSYDGRWPRLGPATPAEEAFRDDPTAVITPPDAAADVGAPPTLPQAEADARLGAALSALKTNEAEFLALRDRYDAQRLRLQRAFERVRPGRKQAWRNAQFELSRLVALVSEMRAEGRAAVALERELDALATSPVDIAAASADADALVRLIATTVTAADNFTTAVSRALEQNREGMV